MKINRAETNEQGVFESSDLSLVTAISLLFPVKELIKENPRKAVFVFNRSKDLDKYIDRYWKKELRVEPRQYFDQLKAIKARLYANE